MIVGRVVTGQSYRYVELLGYLWGWSDPEVTAYCAKVTTAQLYRIPHLAGVLSLELIWVRGCGDRYVVLDADEFNRWCARQREGFALGVYPTESDDVEED